MSKVNCPYCHHPSLEDVFFDELPPIDPPQSGFIDKIDELHHKIRQLDDTVAQLSKDRVELLEELNEAQSSIGVLPREILSRILQFSCSPPEFGSFFSKRNSQFSNASWKDGYCSVDMAQVLNKVSASWRRIIMSTPQVWTSLTLGVDRTTSESDIYFLRQFLDLSGHLPLTLSIYFAENTRFRRDTLIHPSIDALLVKNLGRIENLELNSPPRVWYSHLPQLGQLTHLLLVSLRRPPPEVPLSHVSSLSELTLLGLPITFSSPHITTLKLHAVLPKAIFRTLINCPKLVQLYIRMSNPDMAHDEDGSGLVEPFTLQHLEVLEWTVQDDLSEAALLDYLHLPSLRTLSFIHPTGSHYERSPELQEAASHFFARLPTTLTSLEICGLCVDSNIRVNNIDFITLVNNDLRDDSQIESIALVNCPPIFATDIFQSLTRPRRLPRLSRITLDYTPLDREYTTLVLRAFLDTVDKRLSGCERPLSLYFTRCNRHVKVEWFDCIRSELEELKRRGCEVKIFFESRLVT